MRRCVASKSEDGPADLSELQCRTWLTSPWLSEPPRDDVAGRVVPGGEWPRGHMGRGIGHSIELPHIPWHEDLPDHWHHLEPAWRYENGKDPEVPRELAVACTGSAEEWNRAEFRHPIVSVLVQVARRYLSRSRLQDAEETGLPLHIIVNRDGSLAMATVGRRWWRVAPAAQPNLPKVLADEASPVDIAAVVAEIRWLKTMNPRLFARIAAEGDTPWRDVWAVLWAVDAELVAERSARYRASGNLLEQMANPNELEPAPCTTGSWPDSRCRVMLTYREDFFGVFACQQDNSPVGTAASNPP
ncbi:MAG: hypothetical protein HY902_17355 [Deltaproteobacteria bacterium]|nr:hypothetical protein [Deltaproteobacteria bacterium]